MADLSKPQKRVREDLWRIEACAMKQQARIEEQEAEVAEPEESRPQRGVHTVEHPRRVIFSGSEMRARREELEAEVARLRTAMQRSMDAQTQATMCKFGSDAEYAMEYLSRRTAYVALRDALHGKETTDA